MAVAAVMLFSTACATLAPEKAPPAPAGDPIDLLPVARFTSPADVDPVAHCIGERWARLSIISAGGVTLHPSLRGLIVDVRAAQDPQARTYAEIYSRGGVTHIDYFVRRFVADSDEDLRLRAIALCLR